MLKIIAAGLALSALLSAGALAQPAQCTPENAASLDLAAARDAVRAHMAYPLGGGASVDEAYEPLRAEAAAVRSDAEHLRVLEHFLFALADHHVSLDTNSRSSPRLVPTGASVWVEQRDGRLVVTQVRPGSIARAQGLREGMVITEINGAPASALALPPHTDAGANFAAGFAARVALAGTHSTDARIVAKGPSGSLSMLLPLREEHYDGLASLSFPQPGVALIRINNSLGNSDLPAAFDHLMAQARNTRAILLDLRDTPSGGDSEIAKPLMSWFVAGNRGYQQHRTATRTWIEKVRGRRDYYRGQLIVLVDHWTGSMGEGMAIGLQAAAGAPLVGTRMAGLRGAMDAFPLPCMEGVSIRLSIERLYTTHGTPRELVVPDGLVSEAELAAAGENDAVLAAALRRVSAGSGASR